MSPDRDRTRALASAALVPLAHVLSVPVYVVYEAFVRAINRRPRPVPDDVSALLSGLFTDLDMGSVRVVDHARIPSGHGGLTLGHTVFVAGPIDAGSPSSMRLFAHELVHVRQCRRFGRFQMMRRYGVEWARVLSYRRHPLEIEARRFEAWVEQYLRSEPMDQTDRRG